LVGGVALHFFDESDAVHIRHIGIRDNEMEVLRIALRKNILPVRSLNNVVTRTVESDADDLT